MHRSNSIRPSFTASKTVSSPTIEAPAFFAASAWRLSGGHITQIFKDVLTACGRRNRLRTVGPFLIVRNLIARSYLGDVGGLPTSNALIYLITQSQPSVRQSKCSKSVLLPHGIAKRKLLCIFEAVLFECNSGLLLLFRLISSPVDPYTFAGSVSYGYCAVDIP